MPRLGLLAFAAGVLAGPPLSSAQSAPSLEQPGCKASEGGRVAVLSRDVATAEAWVDFLAGAGLVAWRDDGRILGAPDLVVLASDHEDFPGYADRKVLVSGEKAPEFYARHRIFLGSSISTHDDRARPKTGTLYPSAAAGLPGLLDTPCLLETGAFILHEPKTELMLRSVDVPAFPDHMAGILEEWSHHWFALRERNIALWGIDTDFASLTPAGRRFLINLLHALIRAPLVPPAGEPIELEVGKPYAGVIVGGQDRAFVPAHSWRGYSADLAWDCPADLLAYRHDRREAVEGGSVLSLAWPYEKDGSGLDPVLHVESFGLARGQECRFTIELKRVRPAVGRYLLLAAIALWLYLRWRGIWSALDPPVRRVARLALLSWVGLLLWDAWRFRHPAAQGREPSHRDRVSAEDKTWEREQRRKADERFGALVRDGRLREHPAAWLDDLLVHPAYWGPANYNLSKVRYFDPRFGLTEAQRTRIVELLLAGDDPPAEFLGLHLLRIGGAPAGLLDWPGRDRVNRGKLVWEALATRCWLDAGVSGERELWRHDDARFRAMPAGPGVELGPVQFEGPEGSCRLDRKVRRDKAD